MFVTSISNKCRRSFNNMLWSSYIDYTLYLVTYCFTLTCGPLRATIMLMWPPVKMSLTPLVYSIALRLSMFVYVLTVLLTITRCLYIGGLISILLFSTILSV